MKKEFDKRVFISPGVYTREPFNHQDYIRMVNKIRKSNRKSSIKKIYEKD